MWTSLSTSSGLRLVNWFSSTPPEDTMHFSLYLKLVLCSDVNLRYKLCMLCLIYHRTDRKWRITCNILKSQAIRTSFTCISKTPSHRQGRTLS